MLLSFLLVFLDLFYMRVIALKCFEKNEVYLVKHLTYLKYKLSTMIMMGEVLSW